LKIIVCLFGIRLRLRTQTIYFGNITCYLLRKIFECDLEQLHDKLSENHSCKRCEDLYVRHISSLVLKPFLYVMQSSFIIKLSANHSCEGVENYAMFIIKLRLRRQSDYLFWKYFVTQKNIFECDIEPPHNKLTVLWIVLFILNKKILDSFLDIGISPLFNLLGILTIYTKTQLIELTQFCIAVNNTINKFSAVSTAV